MSMNPTKIDLKRNDYSGHAPCYDKNRFSGRTNEYLEMLRRRAVLKAFDGCAENNVLLDVGCGTGRGLAYLAPHGWRSLVGLDYTRAMLSVADSKLSSQNLDGTVSLLQGDAFELPFRDQSVSAVMSLNFLHMFRLDLQQQLIREMVRVCRPKGVVVVEVESVHKGLFVSRYFEQRRVASRTKFNSMWELRKLFPADLFSSIRVSGTALPLAYRFFSFAPRVGSFVETIAHWQPFKWLCERVIVSGIVGEVELRGGEGRMAGRDDSCGVHMGVM